MAAKLTLLSGHPGATPLLAAVPALAVLAHRWPGVIVFGALSLCSGLAFIPADRACGAAGIAMSATAIAIVTLTTAVAAAHRERHSRTLDNVRSLAGGVQKAVLRPLPVSVPGFRLAGFYCAAEAEARVGGDFYEVIETPHGLRMVLGDVCGKGMPAVDAAVTLLGAFREAAHDVPRLNEVARRMDVSLGRRQRTTGDDRYATALLIEAHQDGTVDIVNCGHVPPLIIGSDGVRELELAVNRPLGYLQLAVDTLKTASVLLDAGCCFVAVTDGITEARDRKRTFYDLSAGLAKAASVHPGDIATALLRDVHRHVGGRLGDDAAALALSRHITP
ncbi:PP2C family protein-serine/threonine phosphatase [Streptomyces vinaceus]|uniref:PP2C family protein-serine/threonine phosphatase n=1 Tax=Streptomyces vinaceus TaxID=1960 RepID=UPI0035E2676F